MKIGYEAAKKNFALCPESPTGLKWLTVENKLKGDKVQPGDHVRINQRWKRGYLPVATIRTYLKKAQREEQEAQAPKADDRTSMIKAAALKAGDGEIDFRRRSPGDEVLKATLSVRFELDKKGNLINRMDFRGAVKGKPVIADMLCVNLNFIKKSEIVDFLLTGQTPTVEMVIPDGSYYRDALRSLTTGKSMRDIMSEDAPEVKPKKSAAQCIETVQINETLEAVKRLETAFIMYANGVREIHESLAEIMKKLESLTNSTNS